MTPGTLINTYRHFGGTQTHLAVCKVSLKKEPPNWRVAFLRSSSSPPSEIHISDKCKCNLFERFVAVLLTKHPEPLNSASVVTRILNPVALYLLILASHLEYSIIFTVHWNWGAMAQLVGRGFNFR